MLSSGYWYVHQMGRKQYESERLPLSLTPEQYDNGVNEPVFIQEVFEGPVELKDAIEFIKSDNVKTKVSLMSGDKANYLPARNLKITVDKEAVVRNGIVPESMKDQIVDEIVWRIPESVNYLYKNDLMLLDFMATNDWTRAVYFTSLSDIKNVLGIDKYLHQEGLSHRFIPVLASDYHKDAGGVYVEGSYELLMADDIRWGNLNKEGVTVDPESRRNLLFVKQAYMRLAQSLLNRGQNDSAVAVLDRCLEFFPDEKIPYDFYMLAYPEIYYKAGAVEKGDELIDVIIDNCLDNLRYYNELNEKFVPYYAETIRENLAIINEMSNIASRNSRHELKMELEKTLEEQFSKFMYLF
jgi:tetratricopeptide (TPR) repeat protein